MPQVSSFRMSVRKEQARAVRSHQGDGCLALRGFLMAGAPSLMPFKGGFLV